MNSGSQVQTTIAVRLVTAAALPANTYSNGLGTVSTGAAGTITANANGAWTVDGVALATDDVIGVKDEADVSNGVYIVSRAGTASTKTLLTRHPLANNAAQFAGMLLVSGPEGTDNDSTVFAYSGAANPVLGTTAISFAGSGVPNLTLAGRDLTGADFTGDVTTTGQVLATGGIGVGNSAAATIAVGTLAAKIEVFDEAGVSLGFLPVYDAIT